MIVFFTTNILGDTAKLEGDEFQHCIKVLRKKMGDRLVLVDGQGNRMTAVLQEISKRECSLLIEQTENTPSSGRKLGIAISPTKNMSRFEWFLEKSTELGITDIYPLVMKRSERKKINSERCQKIVLSAFKQSLRQYIPVLHPLQSFSECLDNDLNDYQDKLIAHFKEDQIHITEIVDKSPSVCTLIGPEGDFSEEELALAFENSFKGVNISENRLRTETAGLVALQYML